VCPAAAGSADGSCANLKTVFGLQNLRRTIRAPIDARDEMMSGRPEVGRDRPLADREGSPAGGDRGEDLHRPPEPRHDEDQVRRQDEGDEGKLVAHDGRELHEPRVVEPHDAAQGDYRDADRAERDGSRVRDEAESRGVERPESEADERRPRDGHRGPESGRPLYEGAEAERDEEGLQPPVRRQAGERRADDLELAALNGDVEEEERREDYEEDREEAECRALRRGEDRQPGRHAPNGDGDGGGGGQREERRLEGLHPEDGEADEHHGEGDRRDGGGEAYASSYRGIDL
jgi:hypothetical protein